MREPAAVLKRPPTSSISVVLANKGNSKHFAIKNTVAFHQVETLPPRQHENRLYMSGKDLDPPPNQYFSRRLRSSSSEYALIPFPSVNCPPCGELFCARRSVSSDAHVFFRLENSLTRSGTTTRTGRGVVLYLHVQLSVVVHVDRPDQLCDLPICKTDIHVHNGRTKFSRGDDTVPVDVHLPDAVNQSVLVLEQLAQKPRFGFSFRALGLEQKYVVGGRGRGLVRTRNRFSPSEW